MMEVGSPSLQGKARPSSVDTGLSLGLPVSDNKGASMSPQGTGLLPPMPVPLSSTAGGYINTSLGQAEAPTPALPISSLGQDARTEALTTLQPGTVDGNRITSTSPPDVGLPPSIPTAAYWTTPTMPQNPLFIPTLLNVGSAKELDEAVPRDAGSENVIIAHAAAPFHTEAMRVEVDDRQQDLATQPFYSEESEPSLTDFNNIYGGGETQLVHDSQVVEANDTQPAIAGETQLVSGDESFDDMEILQNNTFTTFAPPLTNAGPILHESLQGTAAQPLQDSYDGPGSTLSNGIPASSLTNGSTEERETYATAVGLNERVSSTIVSTVSERPEVYPSETEEPLNLTEGKEEKSSPISEPRPDLLDKIIEGKNEADGGELEPRPGLLDENIEGKNEADGGKSPDGVAEIGIKDDVNAKIVSEEDIQAIKGRKVVKKFGRKNFEGEVVDYDAEDQWFKVVYEDGDEEDLNLMEVKAILVNADTSSNASIERRKRSHAEGALSDQARKQKSTSKEKGSAAGARKKIQQVKPPPGLKTEGSKRKAKSKSPAASVPANPVHSQPKIVSEEDIQAIKGRKVVKKFGRKKFEGEVVDYDAENQWFKVVYEDGDDEDLNLMGVKAILVNADTTSNASMERRKRLLPEGAVSDQERKQKATSKKGSAASARKKIQQVKSPPGLKTEGLKRKAKSNSPAKGRKRKRSPDAKLELENVAEEENRKENRQDSSAKSPRKSSAKQGQGKAMAKKNSATKKGTRHRSSKLSAEASEVEIEVGAAGASDKVGKGKSKRRKIDVSKDQNALVGKAVKKDFSGILYSGVVTKFDKKTEYYKVQYEDGDQEDLELEELKAVLVH